MSACRGVKTPRVALKIRVAEPFNPPMISTAGKLEKVPVFYEEKTFSFRAFYQ
jgi:hypothetical protein